MKKTLFLCLLCALLLLAGAALGDDSVSADILLSEGGAQCDSANVSIDGKIITVMGGGTFRLKGTGEDMQVRLKVAKGEFMTLVLDGVELECSFGPALWFDGNEARIEVAEGTQNRIGDSEKRSDNEESPSSGVIFASDSLLITGKGELAVEAREGHGVHCKDFLTVEDAVLKVSSGNDGLRGNDGVTICSGNVLIVARGDGIQASSEGDGKGNVELLGGVVAITAEKDAIQAAGTVRYEGGSVSTRNGEGATDGL